MHTHLKLLQCCLTEENAKSWNWLQASLSSSFRLRLKYNLAQSVFGKKEKERVGNCDVRHSWRETDRMVLIMCGWVACSSRSEDEHVCSITKSYFCNRSNWYSLMRLEKIYARRRTLFAKYLRSNWIREELQELCSMCDVVVVLHTNTRDAA